MEQVLFPLGQVRVTRGINDQMADNCEFGEFVWKCLTRHAAGDWGDDLCQEDKQENKRALEHGSRLFSAYHFQGQKIYIITESDRSATTVLFPSEY